MNPANPARAARAVSDHALAWRSWVRYLGPVPTDKLAELLEAARALSPEERRRLIVELDAIEGEQQDRPTLEMTPMAALIEFSAAGPSDHGDPANKHEHGAASGLDSKR